MAYIISHLWRLLLPVLMGLDVPPLDLQGGGGARPTERTRHLHVLAALRCDVAWHLCKESWKRRQEKEAFEGVSGTTASLTKIQQYQTFKEAKKSFTR